MHKFVELLSPCDQPTDTGERRCLNSAKWVSERFAMGKGREIILDIGGGVGRDGPNLCALFAVSTSK